MFRNKELRNFLLSIIIISVMGMAFIFYINILAGMTALIIFSSFIAFSLFLNKWRYKEIEKLSNYLRQIYGGDY